MACSAWQAHRHCCARVPLRDHKPVALHLTSSRPGAGFTCACKSTPRLQAEPSSSAPRTTAAAAVQPSASAPEALSGAQGSTSAPGASGRPAPYANGADRLASLSRVLLINQAPGSMFRNLANRKWPSAFGPVSLLVFIFGTIVALFAALRSALVRKVKACKCCKGFGVVRCRLCDGRGTVDWRAKFSYSEMCPLCAAKRFVVCPDCGGHYHRRLFNHAKANSMEAFMPAGAGANGATVTQRSTALD